MNSFSRIAKNIRRNYTAFGSDNRHRRNNRGPNNRVIRHREKAALRSLIRQNKDE